MSQSSQTKPILILDFGSQYTQLIARRVRELGVYSEIHRYDAPLELLVALKPAAIILSGSHASATHQAAPRVPMEIFTWGIPILGICYGMQAMAEQLGGQVHASDRHELGHACIKINASNDGLLQDLGDTLDVWMSHGDTVTCMPSGFQAIASTAHCPIAAMADPKRHFYGLQFHPEVTHTEQGETLLKRFLFDIAHCEPLWTSTHIVQDLIETVRRQVGDRGVLLGLSGGVDSSVVAALLHQAIGDQLTCVFVDNGLLRLNEGDKVMAMFAEQLGVHVIRVDAQEQFLAQLAGICDPEIKRKKIGNTFIEVFDKTAEQCTGIHFLAQGTIYPDVIESAGNGTAHVIKSHHNVGGLPDNMILELVEPLRLLFKDEVRKLGIELGLPHEMVYRHPFPGPGLGVRILGEVTQQRADILRRADAIFIEELIAAKLYDQVSQAFAVFLPVNSVGVTGDSRRYAPVIALRAVETIDFMTARWAHLPYAFLGHVSNRIVNEIQQISRVVYDISGKPPATIEWE